MINPKEIKYSKVFELELSNMEGTPVYSLTHQLSVGSEIGNIIIADPSISPRHATFFLQDEVVSLLDHGSMSGTKINGQLIEPGKNIILEESDTVLVGDLELKIKVSVVESKEEVIPPVPVENEELQLEKPPEETFDDVDPFQESQIKVLNLKKSIEKNKRPPYKLVISAPTSSANAIIRVMSVCCDFLLAYSILSIFSPFNDFRMFLEFIPDTLGELVGMKGSYLWSALISDYPVLEEIRLFLMAVVTELLNLSSLELDFVSLVVLYAIIRFVTTLFMGVSISEFFLGMRCEGRPVWSRFGGVVRVITGFVTWPFLIFDIPAIVSRRTLKELVSFTNVIIPSTLLSILGIIFYIPLLLLFLLFSPLIQGLEFPTEVAINSQIDPGVFVPKKSPDDTQAVGGIPAPLFFETSSHLGFDLSYDPQELLLIPDFHFQGSKKRLTLKTGLVLYQKSLKENVEMELFKTFNLKKLLGIAIKGNFFLFDKYPRIYDYVYRVDALSTSFKKEASPKDEALFASEVIKLFSTAFSLNLMNSLDIMQEETLLIKGLIELKSSFFNLLERKEFKDISFIKMGDAIFMKLSVDGVKPYDLLIPLVMDHGKIYKISFSKKETKDLSSSLLYKSTFKKGRWPGTQKREKSETMTALEVHDLFSEPQLDALFKQQGSSQALFGYLFETSSKVLRRGDEMEMATWKNSLGKLFQLLENLPDPKVPGEELDAKSRLVQNTRSIKEAVDTKNVSYFGINTNP